MKVAVVGCGAVGGFYGANLARTGHAVHFLARSDYGVLRRDGILVCGTQRQFRARPAVAKAPEEIGPADLVIVGLKTTANDQFDRLLPPLVGPATGVLTLQNGLGNEEQLARLFPAAQILGGLCFVCLNRVQPGVVHHIAHGLIVLGEFQRPPEARTHEVAAAFLQAGVPCKVTYNLARAHWEKLVWNIPFNGLGVAATAGLKALNHPPTAADNLPADGPCLTTEELLADRAWTQLVHDLMIEVITAANALGFNVPQSVADEQIERTRTMGAYRASTLIDFERGQPLELDSLFLEPLRRAQSAGVKMPRLSALCAVLSALDRTSRVDVSRPAPE
jgi:2-dehydropantoate 2-reductase